MKIMEHIQGGPSVKLNRNDTRVLIIIKNHGVIPPNIIGTTKHLKGARDLVNLSTSISNLRHKQIIKGRNSREAT